MSVLAQEVFDLLYGIDERQSAVPTGTFRWQDIEPLLEQGLLLLTQAEAARTLFWSAGREYSRLRLELLRESRLQDVAEREEAAKRFHVPVSIGETSDAGEQIVNVALQNAASDASQVSSLTDPTVAHGKEVIDREVYLSTIRALYLSPYDQAQRPTELIKAFPRGWANAQDVGQELWRIDQRETAKQAQDTLEVSHAAAERERDTLAANLAASNMRRSVIQQQLDWDRKNEGFLHERLQIDRDVLLEKQRLSQDPDFLDFEAQMALYQRHFQQCAVDAYARLTAVSTGLDKIYGYQNAFPSTVSDFDRLYLWAQGAASWIAGVGRRCNNYRLALSVKDLSGAAWQQGVNSGQWVFDVGRHLLPLDESNFQIRGMSAIGVYDSGATLSIAVTLSSDRTLVRRAKGGGEESDAVQYEIPRCRIGLALNVLSGQISADVGVVSAYNVSPLGQWTIEAMSTSGTLASIKLTDIILYVTLVSWPSASAPVK